MDNSIYDETRVLEIIQRYSADFMVAFEETRSTVVRWEYATGGELFHRGFYLPSPTMDLTIGNAKRGRILKRVTSRSVPTYEFGFNKDDELVVVIKPSKVSPSMTEYELIHREGSYELGISWSESPFEGIFRVSECVFEDGRFRFYQTYHYNAYANEIWQSFRETYYYSETALDVDQRLHRKGMNFILHDMYHFVVSDGRLIEYTYRSGNNDHPETCFKVFLERYI